MGRKGWAFLLGLGAGAGLALIFAPCSGEETQELVRRKTQAGLDQIVSTGQKMREQVVEAASNAKDRVYETKDQLAAALEAGQRAYAAMKRSSA
jgi:gas vesicle protein